MPVPSAEVPFHTKDCATNCAHPDRRGPAVKRPTPVLKGCRIERLDVAGDDVDPHQPTNSVIPDWAFADDILCRKTCIGPMAASINESVDRQADHKICTFRAKPV